MARVIAIRSFDPRGVARKLVGEKEIVNGPEGLTHLLARDGDCRSYAHRSVSKSLAIPLQD
jgi:hypothetical protein